MGYVIQNVRSGKYHAKGEYLTGKSDKARESRVQYRIEENKLRQLFKTELESEFGTASHPKANKLFEIAWSDGHAEGYESVANRYEELVELL